MERLGNARGARRGRAPWTGTQQRLLEAYPLLLPACKAPFLQAFNPSLFNMQRKRKQG